jgi:hypothetical protein
MSLKRKMMRVAMYYHNRDVRLRNQMGSPVKGHLSLINPKDRGILT